ncbi:MAG: peptidoglycan DD-metalloendopeptidase family protein [Desulfotalea sp.]
MLIKPTNIAPARLVFSQVSIFVFIVLFLFPVIAFSANSLKNKERSLNIKIHKLERRIERHEQAIEGNKKRETSILVELETLGKKLQKKTKALEKIKLQVVKQKQLVNLKEHELAQVEEKMGVIEQHLQKRIHAYYTTGQIGAINVAFSSKSLPELLHYQEAFENMVAHDKHSMEAYKNIIDDLKETKKNLNLEKKIIEGFFLNAKQEKLAVAKTKKDQLDLLAEIRNKKELHSQAIAEIKQANKNLTASLGKIKQKQYNFANVFKRKKGMHLPPVKGALITSFLEKTTNSLGITSKSMGIAIEAEYNLPVKAIIEGIVSYAGYLRGYGNTVIINHGYDYRTITARLESLNCTKGQKVKQGKIIGFTGESAVIINKGVYFEVRKGKKSLDPMYWLDPNQIEVAR